MNTYTHTNAYTNMTHIETHTHIYIYMSVCIQTYTPMYTHEHILTDIHTHSVSLESFFYYVCMSTF